MKMDSTTNTITKRTDILSSIDLQYLKLRKVIKCILWDILDLIVGQQQVMHLVHSSKGLVFDGLYVIAGQISRN